MENVIGVIARMVEQSFDLPQLSATLQDDVAATVFAGRERPLMLLVLELQRNGL